MELPERESRTSIFTCRVWFREAVRRLHDCSAISCPDVDDAERRWIELGEQNDGQVIAGGTYVVYQ